MQPGQPASYIYLMMMVSQDLKKGIEDTSSSENRNEQEKLHAFLYNIRKKFSWKIKKTIQESAQYLHFQSPLDNFNTQGKFKYYFQLRRNYKKFFSIYT